ncbi:MAG: hypothetical protein AAF600_06875 [Bacteroidota bacterium]
MNISYDELQHIANHDTLIRGIMGVLPGDFSSGKEYSYQNIYDTIALLDEELLQELNEVFVEMGHEVFQKKEKTAEGEVALHCKTDSFVVKTDTHFPTDYNLLWDSARKCVDLCEQLAEKQPLTGWRKAKDWRRRLKRQMRSVGQITAKGGRNKEERLQQTTEK